VLEALLKRAENTCGGKMEWTAKCGSSGLPSWRTKVINFEIFIGPKIPFPLIPLSPP